MYMLFEMRRLAWLESTKDANDIYKKDQVKQIMKDNWIKLIVMQSTLQEKNFDVTLSHLARRKFKGRSQTVALRKTSTVGLNSIGFNDSFKNSPGGGSILDLVS